jgi:hypothetical protein
MEEVQQKKYRLIVGTNEQKDGTKEELEKNKFTILHHNFKLIPRSLL